MKAFYCNPPRAKKSKYVHRIQKLLRDTVHHESVGKFAAPNAGTGAATNSGYRKKRSIFDELEEEFNQEIEADAQPDVQSEDDGFSEKGNYSPGGAKPSTATPNPKRKLDSDYSAVSHRDLRTAWSSDRSGTVLPVLYWCGVDQLFLNFRGPSVGNNLIII